MYIIQLSDLHISDTIEKSILEKKLEKLACEIKNTIEKDNDIVCCVLGDIIDQGKAEFYETAQQLIKDFKTDLENEYGKSHFVVKIVPGNHDLCEQRNNGINNKTTLESFNEFNKFICGDDFDFTDISSIAESDVFGYHFISISSVRKGNKDYGEINYDDLFKCNAQKNSIILIHHALISCYKDDKSAIREGYKLQQYLEENNIIALIHGHTHGYKRYTVGDDCQIIGVGPIFKQISDISNQCNIIHISGNSVSEIQTLTYHADRDKWDVVKTYNKIKNNNYYDKSIYNLYKKVLQDSKENEVLQNLKIEVNQEFDLFESEINDKFSKYMDDANKWQSFTDIKNLEYTHGQLMNSTSTNWDIFTTDMLKKKPTNMRTIIPLITKEMSYKGGDDKLVSFDLVQFGLDQNSNKLYITIYFRALEIVNFLPINICEAYLMSKKIVDQIKSIKEIDICIFAFRAQKKDSYGCYKKARIDLMSESEICKLITQKSFIEIKEILSEKSEMGDTVIDIKWVEKIKSAFDIFYDEDNKQEVIKKIKTVIESLEILKKERELCSNYSMTQKYENEFKYNIDNLCRILPNKEGCCEK